MIRCVLLCMLEAARWEGGIDEIEKRNVNTNSVGSESFDKHRNFPNIWKRAKSESDSACECNRNSNFPLQISH